MNEIKVGFIAAYDYEMLKQSIPTVYANADKIVIAIDKNRLTFSGKPFDLDPAFFAWINTFDIDNKISVYEDVFYIDGMSVKEIETRKRNLLAKAMGEGGWHFQVDADEYFPDFKGLVKYLSSLGKKYENRRITFRAYLCTIFKIADGGYYLVDESFESFPLVTNYPVYREARYTSTGEVITLNHVVLHQSFGRTYEELKTKFRNWGHRDDFDSESYLRFWQSVSQDNYKYIRNFNATHPWLWKKLKFVKAASLDELLLRTPATYDVKPTYPRLQKWLPPVLYRRIQKML